MAEKVVWVRSKRRPRLTLARCGCKTATPGPSTVYQLRTPLHLSLNHCVRIATLCLTCHPPLSTLVLTSAHHTVQHPTALACCTAHHFQIQTSVVHPTRLGTAVTSPNTTCL